jgi:ABC-2 type transport system ATP-binding protein
MIKAEHLGKKFHKQVAVDDVSFQVEPGKVTGFLGPNGAGKSTTMRLMVGLNAGAGTTTYDGKKLSEYEEPSRVVGTLLEAKAFHPTRTARRHLKALAIEGGVPDKRVDEVLDIVGLRDVANRQPGKFSLGMAQRLGIAAAILGKPKYLILDEPSNGLDPEGIAWMRDFLKDYADQGNAVFISSHLLSELAQMVDDVVVIGRGKLLASGSMQDLIARNSQASVFVRTSDEPGLEKLLHQQSLTYTKSGGSIIVTGARTDDIGKLAGKAHITLLELTSHSASLEDAFLELTEGAEEYKAGSKKEEMKS